MSTEHPRLSIVIPAYNVADFIVPAVQSALDQTFRNLEVIVVDDGSTDATPARLADLAAKRRDARLRIVRQDNGGLSAARNTGIREARGEYIGFLDGDDLWCEDKAAAHIALMDSDPAIGISFSASELLEEDGRRTGNVQSPDITKPSLHQMILRNHVGNGSTPVVRRTCFEVAGDFREDLRSCEDYEIWCRILWLTDATAVGLSAPLTFYRMRKSSLSFDVDRFVKQIDAALDIIQSSMREVPPGLISRARAEHYRIAARKAALAGMTDKARDLLKRVFRLRPAIFLTDRRAMATLASLFVPERGLRTVEHVVASFRARGT
ncbi:glycosyltransferase family 2 protein (plasmid) [Rhizobium grahamii]|uniref:Glycosyltransferase family 2 protein n=1 Tax=Rhizobium grahamii TaxID=1120045 RepID=A0A5Q0CH06_9HYPH|nr:MULTISPECIES: glycosyltransferase family A protein [Rhizobium]QFY63421.1 glycosyltransferase family 2 protein [Rhizobium grahamii]QRM51814.1 glycosyltransferase family 2 protein [Rhizobium sp. BG6]